MKQRVLNQGLQPFEINLQGNSCGLFQRFWLDRETNREQKNQIS